MAADPSRPERDPEITVDLDLDGASPPAPPPPRPRIPNAAFAFAAVIIALAAGVVTATKFIPPAETDAEAIVRGFLEAVLDRDVDAALALTEQPDVDNELLTPEALDTRWEIVEIVQAGYEEIGDAHTRAEVYAEIEAYEGTTASSRFNVVDRDGRLYISGALSNSEYFLNGFHHLELNGITVELPTQPYTRLLPGIYTFYESMPATLDMDSGPVLALGDQYEMLEPEEGDLGFPVPYPAPSVEGQDRVNELVRAHLDACVGEPDLEGCAFALPPDPEHPAELAEDATWEIAAYPTASVKQFSYTVTNAQLLFELVTASPGEVRVEAVVADGAGTRETTLSCAIWMEGWSAVFGFDGSVTVEPRTQADDTCRSVVEVE